MTPPRIKLDLDDTEIVASFSYDVVAKDKLKALSVGWKWNPDYSMQKTGQYRPGAWHVPYSIDRYNEVVRLFPERIDPTPALVQRSRDDLERQAKTTEVKTQGDATVPNYAYATAPYAHQRMGHYLLDQNDSFALLWEMGTGKTKSIIDDELCRKIKGEMADAPALVICPNEVTAQWKRQVPLHSGGGLTAEVLSGPTKKRKVQLMNSTADVVIMNCESLIWLKDELLSKVWRSIIVDEATRFKNSQALRTKILMKMRAKRRRILTGTPITNSPVDAYAPFTFLDPALFGSWWHFMKRYVQKGGYGGYQIIGFLNLEELREKTARVSSRVLKRDVLDLPEKTYYDQTVELNEETLKHYKSMRELLRTEFMARGEVAESKAQIVVTQLLRLAQIAGGTLQQGDQSYYIPDNPKLKALKDIVADLPPTEKVVVYGVYQKELEGIRDAFSDLAPRILYGETPKPEREEIVAEFQDPQSGRRMLLAQIHSGGIGIDLFAAQTVVFYTRNWSLEDYLQAQDRLHRIGQVGTVNIIHLVATLPGEGEVSIDEVIGQALIRKQKFADIVTGDQRKVDDGAVADITAVLA